MNKIYNPHLNIKFPREIYLGPISIKNVKVINYGANVSYIV